VSSPSTFADAAAARPVPHNVKPVSGSAAPKVAKQSAAASSKSAVAPRVSAWKSGSFSGALPSGSISNTAAGRVAGPWTKVGSSGIEVAAGAPVSSAARRRAPAVASKVSASVLSRAAAKKAGLSGLVVQLRRTDGGAGSAPVAVRVPDSLLGAHYGGNYASRLRWVEVTPAGEPVPSRESVPSASLNTLTKADIADVGSAEDSATDSTVLMAQVSSSNVFLTTAGTPTASDGTGSFAATPLSPAASWDVSAQTGDFSWSYGMRAPPAAAGPAPSVALQYDSQSVDGESGSTNNQPSAVGDGWSLAGGGDIERTYVSCSLDDGSTGPVTTSGDLCWKTDNATISFAGHSGLLVKDSTTGKWRIQGDDDTRIEELAGTSAGCAANGTHDTDCWRVTTTDGTQYYFGLNQLPGWSSGQPTTNSTWTVPVYGNDPGEPCHAGSFAASSCLQAWRWNLDYVVDTHGNAEALYYDAESNKYAQDGGTAVSYVRGGQLDHIDYGFTTGNAYAANAASDRVTFTYAADGRCSDATLANCSSEPIGSAASAPTHANYYPDVPFDQLCSSSCPTDVSPTFWTDGMLQSVATYVLKSGSYSKVDSWALGHSFPSPGDGTNAALWLTQVQHTGYSGSSSINEPPTVFTGVNMQNRVWVIDGLAALWKYRISSIQDSLGAVTTINYSPMECTPAMAPTIEASPQSNTYRCFPQQWTPQITPPQPSKTDLFNKYVVTSTISNPETGGGQDQATETDYVYGTPAWRYDTSPLTPTVNRTWNQFAGYNTVEVRVGDHNSASMQNVTDYTFFRGMNGDRASASGGTKSVDVTGTTIPDSLWFAGQVYEQKTLLGVGGAVMSDTVNSMWASPVTANDGTHTARYTGVGTSTTTAPVSTGGNRTTSTVTTFDSGTGLPTTVEKDASDVASTCTTTTYAPANTSDWILGLPSEVDVVASDCAHLSSAVYPGAAISDTKTSYDGGTWNAAATKGDPTQVQIVDKYTGTTAGTAHWVTESSSQYDAFGRVTQTTDVLGHTTSTAYTPSATAPAGSGALTSQTTTNTAPFGWTTTTAYDPAWGVETSYTDQNSSVTTASYDALGRRVGVWDPDNPQASAPSQPSIAYGYTQSQTSANAIETKKLVGTAINDSFVLYDGLGRQVQTQAPAEGGGSDVTDNWYDSQGRVWTTNGDYWAAGATPSATLFVPGAESQIAQENVTTFDAIGRPTKQTLLSFGIERHETDTSYSGVDRVDVTPPAGGTPTSTFTNSLGEKTQLLQYLAATPTGTSEATTYSYDPSGDMTGMTDQAGNSWTWAFDVLGHQTSATDPDTGTTTQTFDDAGNVLTATDARGITLAYSYDALNRKTAEYQNAVGSSGIELASWSYDTATLGKGLPAVSTRYVGSSTGMPGAHYVEAVNMYDAAGNPTKTTVTIPSSAPAFAGSYITTSTYATSGDLTSTTLPAEGGLASERLRWGYDATGRVSSLHGSSSYDSVGYTAIGQVNQHTRYGTYSLYTEYGYDSGTGQLLSLEQDIDDGIDIHPTVSTYSNDDAGNVTSISTTSDAAATDTQCFSYDRLQELTAAWTPSSGSCSAAPTAAGLGGPAPYWIDYAVDPATGNRTGTTSTATSGTATTASYDYATAGSLHPHAVNSVTTTVGTGTPTTASYGYNAEGDTTTRPGETLTYDAEGNLATVVDGAKTQSNVYDADGTLLLQNDDGNYTLYMGATELHKDGSGSVYCVRTYSIAGTAIAERTNGPTGGNTLRWLGSDNHNTAMLEVVASTGATTVRYEDPYGNPRGTNPTWSSGHTFLGDDQAITSGTVTIGARTYDPAIGKFLTIDAVLAPMNPLQNEGYAYSANNPIRNTDPSGECYSVAGVSGCVGYIHTPGGANLHSEKTNPVANAPWVAVSPHIYVPGGDKALLKQANSAYVAARQAAGMASNEDFTSEWQEMSVWLGYCLAARNCPDSIKLALLATVGTSDRSLEIGGLIAGGTAFLFANTPGDGSGGSSAEGSDDYVVRSLGDPESMEGVTEDQLRAMVPEGMEESAMAQSRGVSYGVRWVGPGRSGQIEFSHGNPFNPDALHREPYLKVRVGGLRYRVAAFGSSLVGTPEAMQGKQLGNTGKFDLGRRFLFGGAGGADGE
jgi:RHS repeat-associated protein